MKSKTITGLLCASCLMAGLAYPLYASENDPAMPETAQESFSESTGSITPENFFIPEDAPEAEFNAVAASNIQVVVHYRGLDGKWNIQKTTLTKDKIGNLLYTNAAHTEMNGYINPQTIYPEDHISYSGIYNGDENAQSRDPGAIKLVPGQSYIGMGTLIMLSKTNAGKWVPSLGNLLEYYAAKTPLYTELKAAQIEFYSDTTKKSYRIPLIEGSYEAVSLDETRTQGCDAMLIVNLKLEKYKEELSRLTGKQVKFGGYTPEAAVGQISNAQRQVLLKTNKYGVWTFNNEGFDIDGRLTNTHTGISFVETDAAAVETKSSSMHRLYNPNSGEHFYTSKDEEKNHLVSVGWKYEGEGWKAPEKSSKPVYRLYNPNAGDHHYTLDKNEKDTLVKVGWNDEGIGWYSDEAEGVPLYRQYNPNAKAGSHNYTTDKNENDGLVKLGWKAEGIGWYGLK